MTSEEIKDDVTLRNYCGLQGLRSEARYLRALVAMYKHQAPTPTMSEGAVIECGIPTMIELVLPKLNGHPFAGSDLKHLVDEEFPAANIHHREHCSAFSMALTRLVGKKVAKIGKFYQRIGI